MLTATWLVCTFYRYWPSCPSLISKLVYYMEPHSTPLHPHQPTNSQMFAPPDEPLPALVLHSDSEEWMHPKQHEHILKTYESHSHPMAPQEEEMQEESYPQSNELEDQVLELNNLLGNLQVLERAVVTQADDPIFEYPIGFDSDPEGQEPEIKGRNKMADIQYPRPGAVF